MDAAILFEPDGYLLTGPKLMGRQVAGSGFLRAAVLGRDEGPVVAYSPFRRSAEIFDQTVKGIDPTAETRWISGQQLSRLSKIGVLYRPDQVLGPTARQRLRVGPAAYSLCGVTHTLSSAHALDAVAGILREPVMPWDALICASAAAKAVVETVLEHQAELERWRVGQVAGPRPLLPVIPLGVHTGDFARAEGERETARTTLGVAPDAVALLFAGRFSFNGKAHPYPMLRAIQKVAEDVRAPIVLIMAGHAFNAAVADAFRSAVSAFCPAVQAVWVDGRDPGPYRAAWAASDIFVSLSDSIQESFGITPLEAMASGLPSLVSDWNGYRDTVRDGIDGFRIPTWAPPPGTDPTLALDYESGLETYDEHLARTTAAVAVDMAALCARLRDLVENPELRRTMGRAARERAVSTFDWSVVFGAYKALWAEQTQVRLRAAADPATRDWLARAPGSAADHLDPFELFASFPTQPVSPQTRVAPADGATVERYRELISHITLSHRAVSPEVVGAVLRALAEGPMSAEALAAATGLPLGFVLELASRLSKIDLLALG